MQSQPADLNKAVSGPALRPPDMIMHPQSIDDHAPRIRQVAEGIGSLAVTLADVSGDVDDVSALVLQNRDFFKAMQARVASIADQGRQVGQIAGDAMAMAGQAKIGMGETQHRLGSLVSHVTELTDHVVDISSRLVVVTGALQRLVEVSETVSRIARQTNLLSLNASVEAARVGEQGRGFMVIAREVKELSNKASQATTEISSSLSELEGQVKQVIASAECADAVARGIRSETGVVTAEIEKLPQSCASMCQVQSEIVAAAQIICRDTQQADSDVARMSHQVERASSSLGQAAHALVSLTGTTERLTTITSHLGIETVDSRFINAVQDVAAQVSEVFAAALHSGRISMDDLFDEQYRRIAGSDPIQYMTRFTRFADAVLPALQEPMLQFDPKVVFCAAIDRNGYISTHNLKFGQQQRVGEPEWNARHARSRRIFDDRVGLGAGRNRNPFLLQAYRRDMGHGDYVMMKDVSSPVTVAGKHWGGVRLAYRA